MRFTPYRVHFLLTQLFNDYSSGLQQIAAVRRCSRGHWVLVTRAA